MNLNDLKSVPGSTHAKKIIGRGHGTGQGKTAGKGHKGQRARAGKGFKAGFEGGQMPLQRRVPKRGFNNVFRKNIVGINVSSLEIFDNGAVVDEVSLNEKGLLKGQYDAIKILGNGELTKKLTVKASLFSETAKEKIEKSGGNVEVI